MTRNKLYESLILILVAFTLFRPGFWMDMVVPPFKDSSPEKLVEVVAKVQPGEQIRLMVDGLDDIGSPRSFVAIMTIPDGKDGAERLSNAGLDFSIIGDEVVIDNAAFDSAAAKAGLDFDQKIMGLQAPNEQPPKHLMYIPAVILLFLIVWLQRRRRDDAPSEPKVNTVEA